MGVVVNSGCKKTRNTGTRASVKKKFQCTPYSVTCSFIHHLSSAVLWPERKGNKPYRILRNFDEHHTDQTKRQNRRAFHKNRRDLRRKRLSQVHRGFDERDGGYDTLGKHKGTDTHVHLFAHLS
jgi:hypothetical protein